MLISFYPGLPMAQPLGSDMAPINFLGPHLFMSFETGLCHFSLKIFIQGYRHFLFACVFKGI